MLGLHWARLIRPTGRSRFLVSDLLSVWGWGLKFLRAEPGVQVQHETMPCVGLPSGSSSPGCLFRFIEPSGRNLYGRDPARESQTECKRVHALVQSHSHDSAVPESLRWLPLPMAYVSAVQTVPACGLGLQRVVRFL